MAAVEDQARLGFEQRHPMAAKSTIIHQNKFVTKVKCPKCKNTISLWHGPAGEPNDGIGRLDLGHQNYNRIVCVNLVDNRYCDYEGNFSI